MRFIGEDPITVGAIHESPAVPKRQSVRMFFSLYGRFVNRPYNLFKHPAKPKFESPHKKDGANPHGHAPFFLFVRPPHKGEVFLVAHKQLQRLQQGVGVHPLGQPHARGQLVPPLGAVRPARQPVLEEIHLG